MHYLVHSIHESSYQKLFYLFPFCNIVLSMVYDISSSFEYNGKTIFVSWCTIRQKSAIPDLPWQQVYTIGDLAGSVPLVYNAVKKSYNLPGGKTESGETIEQTITREMVEECNMRVIEW